VVEPSKTIPPPISFEAVSVIDSKFAVKGVEAVYPLMYMRPPYYALEFNIVV
jgi:hypothetical protein